MNIGGNLKHMWELALTDAVPVHDDPVGLVAPGALVEHGQVLLHLNKTVEDVQLGRQVNTHHCRQILNDLLSVLLNPHSGRIPSRISCSFLNKRKIFIAKKPAWMSVLASHNCGNAWLPVVPDRGVGHVCAQEDHLNNQMCTKVHQHSLFSTHRLVENFWSDGWNQDRVHSSQFHIDLGLIICGI